MVHDSTYYTRYVVCVITKAMSYFSVSSWPTEDTSLVTSPITKSITKGLSFIGTIVW